ncbi:MAG: hypothetical protein SGILL_008826 [Bacillariaceae sp.]
MSNYIKNEEAVTSGNDHPSAWHATTTFSKPEANYEEYRQQIRKDLHDALSQDDMSIDWTIVQDLLMKLLQHQATFRVAPQTREEMYASTEDDPLGRIFLTRLVSRDPPVECLDIALQVFPYGICSSHPVAFFSACSNASMEVIDRMFRHTIDKKDDDGACPYPWILSQFINLEAAQKMMQAYPQGVLQKPVGAGASFLISESIAFSPLEYVMFSPTMIQKSELDEALWQKFKMMLLTVESLNGNGSIGVGCQISPVHTIHVFWLLRELRASDEWVFQKQRPHDNGEGLFPLHLLLSTKCPAKSQSGMAAARELCKILLEADTLAVMHGVAVQGGELFPLHVAIENGWPCHDLLLSIWPESIERSDPRTGLLPFQSALTTTAPAESSMDLSLDIAFELLRANPTIT